MFYFLKQRFAVLRLFEGQERLQEAKKQTLFKEKERLQVVLPYEIIQDILSRLPVKTLLRFKYVSKAWRTLIDSSDFVEVHLKRSNRNNDFILLRGKCDVFSLEYEACDHVVKLDYPSGVSISTFADNLSHQNGLKHLSSCNGLVCIGDERENTWLWNPSTRKHKKIPKSVIRSGYSTGSDFSYYSSLGFGYNSISRDYEIVRFVCFEGYICPSEVKVYSSSKNSWTWIATNPYTLCNTLKGELLDGALHWLGVLTKEVLSRGVCGSVIIAFHIDSKEFREVQLPDYEQSTLHRITVSVLDGYLCVLINYSSDVEVWVMKEYGVKESWIKLFTCEELRHPLGMTKKGEFILQENNEKLCLYDPKEQSLRDIITMDIMETFGTGTASFLESLVQL